MSHFYGTLQGHRGQATRCGTKNSGMRTVCASWQGAVECLAFVDPATGEDYVEVGLVAWHGKGCSPPRILYRGPISGD